MTPRILYVDDDPATGNPRLEQAGIDFREKLPCDVANDDAVSRALDGIKLVLMDYRLRPDDTDSQAAIDGLDSQAPIDGLELIERFRATIRRHGAQRKPVPVLAIYTSLRDELAQQLDDCPNVPYMLARRANVDWVFDKRQIDGPDDPFKAQLQDMLDAFDRDLSACGGDPQIQLCSFLNLPELRDWSELAREQLIDASPPMRDLSHDGPRAKLMRWLLQVALPFPGCLVGIESVAVRLNMDRATLDSALDAYPESELNTLLQECRYDGALQAFFPPRYWAAGIDAILWHATRGRSMANADVRKQMTGMVGTELEWLTAQSPVLVVSPETFELDAIADLSEAVQFQPEAWPPEIDPPWVRISEIEHDLTLRAMVVSRDRDRLPEWQS